MTNASQPPHTPQPSGMQPVDREDQGSRGSRGNLPDLQGSRTDRWRRIGCPALGIWACVLVVSLFFGWIIADIIWHGIGQLSWAFFFSGPRNSGRDGGIAPILVSTGLILAICLGVSLPIGVGTAVLLAEFTPNTGRFGRLVRGSLDVLAGVPSVVFGLFGNAFFSGVLGLGFSILSGGLTLTCMVLPLLIRTTEMGLRAVPLDYRLGAAALGLSQRQVFWRMLLPVATPGLMAGLVLSIGRALAETAALIFTSGYVDRMPRSLLDSGRSLSIHIYDLSMNVAGGSSRAYGSALVLVGLLLTLNLIAAWVSQRWLRQFQGRRPGE